MSKIVSMLLAILLSQAATALAAEEGPKQVNLLPDQSLALPWIVGFGIFVGIFIAGFKHPGRTHLD